MTEPSPSLADIMRRLSVAGDAWAASGYGYDGDAYQAREAVFAELRAWNEKHTSQAWVPSENDHLR